MTNFENILDLVGWGCYQRVALVICGLCALVQALGTMGVSYILPLSSCEHKIYEDNVVLPLSVYFCGLAFGGYILGCFSDCVGRRAIIGTGLVTIFIGTMGCSFSTSTAMLCISALIIGFGANGTTIASAIFLAEMVPLQKRGKCIVLIDLFWIVGYIIGIAMFMYMVPYAIMEEYTGKSKIRLISWRVIMAIGGVVCIMQTTITGLLCRSPRLYVALHRPGEAVEVLKRMYALNKSMPMNQLEVPNLVGIISTTPLTTIPMLCLDALPQTTEIIKELTKTVFQKNWKYRTFGCILVYTLIFHETIISNLWLADVLDISPQDATNCYVGYKNFVQLNYTKSNCSAVRELPYSNLLILASAMLVNHALLAFTVDLLSRPILLSLLSFLATVCYSIMASTKIQVLRYIAVLLLVIALSSARTVYNVAVIEMYPTAVRGTVIGLVRFLGQMSWCIVFFFIWTPCHILFTIQGLLMLVSPDTATKASWDPATNLSSQGKADDS